MKASDIMRGLVMDQVGRPKGGQHHNGPVYYPAKISHPDFPDIVIQVGGERSSTLHNVAVAKSLFLLAIEEIYKTKLEL